LATVLNWTGLEVSPQDLGALVFDPQLEGSLQASMKAAARRHGRLAYEIHGRKELLREVAAGHPVIVLQNLGLSWRPVYHYSVVSGYDLNTGTLLLLSGQSSPEVQRVGVFDATWSRAGSWGLLVLPPEEPPARPKKARYIKALLGLEQAGRTRAAARGYEAFLALWPEDQTALLGLANCSYQSGKLQKAAEVLTRAVEFHPGSAALQNNLAHVLMELGRLDRALAAARRAVSLKGPNLEVARSTLTEIERLKRRETEHPTGSAPRQGAGRKP
jgi:tetratricopeptide (TPR) repeat protein